MRKMTIRELAGRLAELRRAAKGIGVIIFGVRYDGEIDQGDHTVAGIVRVSGIETSYAAEVSKGRRLAPYVSVTRMPHSD